MGRRKGREVKEASENLIPLSERSPEERKRISRMGVEAKRKKKEQNMALQNCMRQLLEMKTNSDKKKQVLRSFGFTDEELTNRSLLMVALFQKGLTGDVSAIKEITDMMDKLDMFENTGKITSNVTINLVATGRQKTEQIGWRKARKKMTGEMISTRDSVREASAIEIARDYGVTLRSYHLTIESGLKGQINGLQRLSVLEWIRKHTEQNEVFSKNILTNTAEHSKIGV